MFIEREMSRDHMAAIIWTAVTSCSKEKSDFILKREMQFAYFDFQTT